MYLNDAVLAEALSALSLTANPVIGNDSEADPADDGIIQEWTESQAV
jgi:hypothetical protein